jgi:hypothetical protein
MKYSILFFITLTGIIVSCNNEPKKSTETTTPEDTSKPVENKVMIPNMVCYSSATGKDTFFLKVEKFPNVVTGSLSYKFYEKDSNKGDIDGKLYGDTLIADYKFMSEGKQSIRQIVFLIKDSVATEGYGPMEEREGKMVFKNLKEVDFRKGKKLQKISCPIE